MGSRLEKKSTDIRKRIETHTFDDEGGDEYGASKFGGFPEYFRRKKIKLQNLDAERRAHSDHPAIFRGIVAHVNGYTQPSLNDLHDLIVRHGGGFIQYLDGKTMVTHIIASNLTPKKVVEFRRYRMVKPAWIVDSVNAGRLLPWNDYRVVDEGAGQKQLGFDGGQMTTQTNVRSRGYKEQSDTSWYNTQLRARPAIEDVPDDIEDDVLPSQPTQTDNASLSLSDFDRLEAAARQGIEPSSASASAPALAQGNLSSPPTSPLSHISEDQAQSAQDALPGTEFDKTIVGPPPPKTGTKRSPSPQPETPNKAAKLTAEEHNAILLADPRVRKSTVVHPDFLDQYYRESRLHHLSTWKADLKSKLQSMTIEQSHSQRATTKRNTAARRYIMHVDFDSFFVAVSLKKAPHFAEKPAVVAHGSGSGSEIASCNYPARAFGVKNGMWMRTAQVLCSDLVVLPYDFPGYEEASRHFYQAILATGGIVQSVSIDEALVDISAECIAAGGSDGVRAHEGAVYREQAKAEQIAQTVRDKVFDSTGCHVSVGIGANILLAKVALRKAKPAGQFHLKPDAVLEFIGELEVQHLPGVASSLGSKLEDIGIKYVKDIRDCTREKLTATLGPKTGEKIWDYARGIDRTEVGDQVIRKSVSAEVNWGVRFENQDQVDEFIQSLCGELQKRLIKENVKGRQLTVKIMRRSLDAPYEPPKHLGHGKCDVHNKSVQLGVATYDATITSREALTTMRGFGFTPGELRGIGIQMQKLEPIKSEGPLDGSQKRLQFQARAGPATKTADKIETEDPILDDTGPAVAKRVQDIDEGVLHAPAMRNSPSKKPLNILGTQFALPTQVDPAVLAELPADIRSRLMPKTKPDIIPDVPVDKPPPQTMSVLQLPNQSQLDADTLAALPEEVRAEILASYETSPRKLKAQQLLPQSPRKNRVLPPGANNASGAKRTRMSLFASSKRNARGDNSTLTQSNFAVRPVSRGEGSDTTHTDTLVEDLDPDFLAALPDGVRQEVIQQHRQARLRKSGGIDLSMHQRSRARKPGRPAQTEAVERLFHLPPRAPRPTFTTRKLSEIEDLRAMIKDWVAEFSEQDPFEEDVNALIAYLVAVVSDEANLDKAVKVVKWLAYTIENFAESHWQGDEVHARWDGVLENVKAGVQGAVRERRLGPVVF